MLTILTSPKPSIGKMQMDFLNALHNWSQLCPQPEIFVFGGDEGLVESEGVRYITSHHTNELGLPYLDSVYQIAQHEAKHDVFMLVSDHLMFMPGLMEAVQRCKSRFPKFLAVGQRHDVDVVDVIDFTRQLYKVRDVRSIQDWRLTFLDYIAAGRLHGPSAKDYMIFSRDFPIDIPPFLLGRPWYDSWFVSASLDAGIPVVDLTATVVAIHPNHDYAQIPGQPAGNHGNPGEEYNAQLAVGVVGRSGHTTRSQWIDTPMGIKARLQL